MSDLNLEVWKPIPIIPIPGTYVSRFNRYYLSINPNAAEGPPTWRISDPDEFPCDGGVIIPPGTDYMVVAQAPMVVTGDATGIKYSFSLDGVPFMDTIGDSLITSIDNLNQPVILSNIADNPVRSVFEQTDHETVTTFYIYGLKHVSSSLSTLRTMRATVYNSNSSIPVSSSEPVQTASNVSATDLFLDISSLSHAT